jgi:hypothetical protein
VDEGLLIFEEVLTVAEKEMGFVPERRISVEFEMIERTPGCENPESLRLADPNLQTDISAGSRRPESARLIFCLRRNHGD